MFLSLSKSSSNISPLPSLKLPLHGSTVLCHIKYALIRCLMDMQARSNYDVGEPAPG